MPYEYINAHEKSVLSALFKGRGATVGALSKATFINRTTLYPILEKLLEKGLVTKIQTEGNTIFKAVSLPELSEWMKRKENEVKKASTDLMQWAKNQSHEHSVSLQTEIKHYQGLEGVMSLYDDTWRENTGKIIYALTDYERAYSVIGDTFLRNDYFNQRIRHGVRVQSLLPESPIGKKELKMAKELLREMRFIDLFKNLGIEINIYDNKVAIFAFDKHHPSGVLIKNDIIADAFKNIFQYLWRTTSKKN